MIKTVTPFSLKIGFSKLFQDFIGQPHLLDRFFGSESLIQKAEKLLNHDFPRTEAFEILTRQNQQWQAPPEVFRSIDRVKDTHSVFLFSGQQSCLFGGPYLVILKALALVRAAEKLEKKLSIPVIPVFWIAADDHDFAEIATVDIFDSTGNRLNLMLDIDERVKFPPAGCIKYDDSINRELDRLIAALPDSEFKSDIVQTLQSVYKPGQNIVDCFARYLHHLIGRFGIVLFSPYDKQFKSFVRPALTGIVKKRNEIARHLKQVNDDLLETGYHIQAKKSESAAYLFRHLPERIPVRFKNSKFIVDNESFSAAELIDLIDKDPIDFSPDVLTRLLMQSYFFPTIAIMGGSSEIAYFAQALPLFDIFDRVKPAVIARPSATLVEIRFEKMMDERDITLTQIAHDLDAKIDTLMRDSFPEEIRHKIESFGVGVVVSLEKIKGDLVAFDPNLNDVIEKSGGKIDYILQELNRKIFAAHKKKNKTERRRLLRLQAHLFPGRALAERSISIIYFQSRYGKAVYDFIYENLKIDETGHQLLTLSGLYE